MTLAKKIQDFNVDDVQYGEIISKSKGPKSVRMTIPYNKPIVLQIEKSRIPFGLSSFGEDDDKVKKYSLEIEMPDDLLQCVEELEELNKKHCKTLWGDISDEIINERYNSMIRVDKNGVNPSRLKLKLNFFKGKPIFNVASKDAKEINFSKYNEEQDDWDYDWDWAKPGMEVRLVIECEGLWILGTKVYCTWRAKNIKIISKGGNNEYSFIDDSEEEEEEIKEEICSSDEDMESVN